MTTFFFCFIFGAASCSTAPPFVLHVHISAHRVPAVCFILPTEPRQLCSSCCSFPLAAVSHHPILTSLWLLILFICPCPLLFGVNHAVICVWWVVFLIHMCVYIYILPLFLMESKQFGGSRARAKTSSLAVSTSFPRRHFIL